MVDFRNLKEACEKMVENCGDIRVNSKEIILKTEKIIYIIPINNFWNKTGGSNCLKNRT